MVEVHRLIRDHHPHPVALGIHADTVADVRAVAVADEAWVQFPVDDEHRAGLRGMTTTWRGFLERAALDHCRLAFVQTQDPVRQKAEVAGTVRGDNPHLLLAVFHVEPHRGAIIVEHARVHRDPEVRAFGQNGLDPAERPEDLSCFVAQEQAHVRVAHLDFAGRKLRVVEKHRFALGVAGGRSEKREGQKKQPHHASVSPSGWSSSSRTSSTSRRTSARDSISRVASIWSKVWSITKRRSGRYFSFRSLPSSRRNSPLLRFSASIASSLPEPPSGIT
mmetsp:Transcript_552/g.845  ORF Transcript_552/g.845 Transcript_552/m.845 type:complete len:277 (+) Transcript_552:1040-1870(+)